MLIKGRKALQETGWISAPDFVFGDRFCDNRTGCDDGIVSNRYAFADNGICSNKDIVSDEDRRFFDICAGFVSAGANRWIGAMEIRIEDLDAAADQNMISNCYGVICDDGGI